MKMKIIAALFPLIILFSCAPQKGPAGNGYELKISNEGNAEKGGGLVRIEASYMKRTSGIIIINGLNYVPDKKIITDLFRDGTQQLLLYADRAGAKKTLIALNFSGNSWNRINMPEIAEFDAASYRGRDSVSAQNGVVSVKFPVYKDGDKDCCPSGGEKTIAMELAAGRDSFTQLLDGKRVRTKTGGQGVLQSRLNSDEYINRAKTARNSIASAIANYYGNNNSAWPPSLDGLVPQYLNAVPAEAFKDSADVAVVQDSKPGTDNMEGSITGAGGYVYFSGSGDVVINIGTADKNGVKPCDYGYEGTGAGQDEGDYEGGEKGNRSLHVDLKRD